MNFVCLVFELGDKTLTLSPMENLNGEMQPCGIPTSRIWNLPYVTKAGLESIPTMK